MPKQKFLKTSIGIFLLGMLTAEIMPSIIDPIHFWLQKYILDNASIISQKMLIFLNILDWYFLEAFFVLLLILIAYILHIKKKKTIEIIITIGAIMGISIVIGLFWRFLF